MKEACSNCRFFRGEMVNITKEISTNDLFEDTCELPEAGDDCDEFYHTDVVFAHRFTDEAAEGADILNRKAATGYIHIKHARSVERGICRRYPPSAGEAISVYKADGIGIAVSLFPVVKGGEWCGEYQKASN